jgi:hypothetical protein
MQPRSSALVLALFAFVPVAVHADAPAARPASQQVRARTALKLDLAGNQLTAHGVSEQANGVFRGPKKTVTTQAKDDAATPKAKQAFKQVRDKILQHEHFAHSSHDLITAAFRGAVAKAGTAGTLAEIYGAATDAMVAELKKVDRWSRVETQAEYDARTTPAANNITSHRLPGDLLIVKMRRFRGPVASQIQAAIADARKRGPVQGLILDLRGNGGGSVSEARDLVSQFLPTGQALITTEYGPLGAPNSVEVMRATAQPTGVDTKTPIVVLVDGRSASASELSTGILKDVGRVTIFGDKTFGKGVGQASTTLADGRVFTQTQWRRKLATLGYYHGVGLQPDVDGAAAKANVSAAAQAGKLRDRGDAVLRGAILHLWKQQPASNDNARPSSAPTS